MAKHYVYPRSFTDGVTADNRIELHWQRDMYVQIASTRWAGDPGTTPDTTLDYLPGTASNEPSRAWDGQFVDLPREQINHLIKQLRAARDQAYGRDE